MGMRKEVACVCIRLFPSNPVDYCRNTDPHHPETIELHRRYLFDHFWDIWFSLSVIASKPFFLLILYSRRIRKMKKRPWSVQFILGYALLRIPSLALLLFILIKVTGLANELSCLPLTT
jgi:hypothetical protein